MWLQHGSEFCVQASSETGPVRQWSSMVRKLRSKFRWGINRSFLERSYARHNIRSGTRISGPSSTRFFVHTSAYLGQSIRHYSPRYEAILECIASLQSRIAHNRRYLKAGRRADLKDKLEQMQKLGKRLADLSAILLVVLVDACLQLPGGGLGWKRGDANFASFLFTT